MAITKRYGSLNVTVPAGTQPGAPLLTPWNVGDVWLYNVSVRIPPGHFGTTGFYVTWAGTVVVPWSTGPNWINGDDENPSFDVNEEIGNGLTIVAYNQGVWAHTFYFQFAYVPIISTSMTPAATVVAIA